VSVPFLEENMHTVMILRAAIPTNFSLLARTTIGIGLAFGSLYHVKGRASLVSSKLETSAWLNNS
jgi:hypothetical protein